MGVNKVDLANGENLIDLTSDTVTPQTLAKGVTAHNSKGEQIIGNLNPEGGGGGSGIIDVTELPTENIDENAVYRVTESYKATGDDLIVVMPDEETGETLVQQSLLETYGEVLKLYVVDELPADMKITDIENGEELYIYLLRTDGIGYINALQFGAVIPIGVLFFDEEGFDKGITDNVYAETEIGIYSTFESYEQIIRWFIRENGEWKEISSRILTTLSNGATNIADLSGSYDGSDITVTDIGVFNLAEIIETERKIPLNIYVDTPSVASLIEDKYPENIPLEYFKRADGTYVEYVGRWKFYGAPIKSVDMPDCIANIGYMAFVYCTNLALTSLPNSLKHIDDDAFNFCHNLALTSLPENLTHIGDRAFADCDSLVSLTFQSTPSYMGSLIFNGCNNLTTINVPWAEGEVQGAPWGATNVTINYNYTEG